MAILWSLLAAAGVGALHGLNPATGWMLAAAWGLRSGGRTQVRRALLPIALGHAASVALVGGALAIGLSLDRFLLQVVTGALFVVAVVIHLSGRVPMVARAPAGHAGLALWSFTMSTAHGAGLMLVPALIPLCVGGPATGGMTLALALLAVVAHTAAMLAVTGVIASGVCRNAGLLRGVKQKLTRGPR